jgi:hypothetical protein
MVAERRSPDGGQHPALDRKGKIPPAVNDDGTFKLFSMKTETLATEFEATRVRSR